MLRPLSLYQLKVIQKIVFFQINYKVIGGKLQALSFIYTFFLKKSSSFIEFKIIFLKKECVFGVEFYLIPMYSKSI